MTHTKNYSPQNNNKYFLSDIWTLFITIFETNNSIYRNVFNSICKETEQWFGVNNPYLSHFCSDARNKIDVCPTSKYNGPTSIRNITFI